MGLIEIKVGSKGGAFICSEKKNEVSADIKSLIGSRPIPLDDLINFWEGVEGLASTIAAKRVYSDNISELKRLLNDGRLKSMKGDFGFKTFINWDFEMHKALVAISDNVLFESNIKLVQEKISEHIDDTHPSDALGETGLPISEYIKDWDDIITSIEKRHADNLKSLAQTHIRKLSQVFFERSEAVKDKNLSGPFLTDDKRLRAATSESNREAILMFAGADLRKITTTAKTPVNLTKWKLPALTWWTGEWLSFGMDAKFGMDMAVEEINNSGGISGIPIELTWYDTGYDADQTSRQINKVLDTKPLMILGPLSDIPISVACPIAYQEKIFILSGASDNVPFIESYPWGTCLLSTLEGITKAAANYWYGLHGKDVKSMVLFSNPASRAIQRQAAMWLNTMEEKGIIVHNDMDVTSDTTDYSHIVERAIASESEAFINLNQPEQAANINKELYKRGVTEGWRIVNYPASDHMSLYENARGYLEGTYVYNLVNLDFEGKKWRRFMERYKRWKNDNESKPSYVAPYSFDIPFIVKKAFEDLNITGSPYRLEEERRQIMEYILNLKDFEGIQGSITAVKGTGGVIRPIFFYRIQGNKPKLIATLKSEMILP